MHRGMCQGVLGEASWSAVNYPKSPSKRYLREIRIGCSTNWNKLELQGVGLGLTRKDRLGSNQTLQLEMLTVGNWTVGGRSRWLGSARLEGDDEEMFTVWIQECATLPVKLWLWLDVG